MNRIISLLLLLIPLHAITQISIDDDFSDWTSDKFIVQDIGDVSNNKIDIETLSIDHDTERIYFKITLNKEISLQNANALKIYIDLDNNVNTGFTLNGIGSELSFFFGSRTGFLNVFGQTQFINHAEVGLVSMPTTTGKEFEFSFNRIQYYNNIPFTTGPEISVYLFDDTGAGADKIPNGTGGIIYNTEELKEPNTYDYQLQKSNAEHLRVMSYNSQFDGFFNIERQQNQRDIVTSMNPDILAFQEIYESTASDVKQVMEEILPNNTWYTASFFPDIIIASKYEILQSKFISGNGGFIICADSNCEKKVLIINAHLPCCDNDEQRQEEIDQILRAIRLAKTDPSYALYIEEGTPIIILGDLNLVGESQQLTSLLTGDIIDNNQYGPDINMDWDNNDLKDSKPETTGAPYGYTWYNPFDSYSPGRLDFILYTSSVIQVENTFTLATPFLNNTELQDLELSANTVTKASDHFPIITDFNLNPSPPTPLTIALIEGTSPLCFGESNGSIHIQAQGGEAPYLYSLNNGAYMPTNNFDTLPAGTYEINIKDNLNAEITESFMLTQPDAITVNTSNITNQLIINAAGGTPPYEYSINNVDYQSSNTFNNLDRGNYIITVRDDNNCIIQQPYELYYVIDQDMDGFDLEDDCDDTNPNINPDAVEIPNNTIDENCDGIIETEALLVISLDILSPSCFEYSDGSINANVSGGEEPYAYSLNGSTFQSSNIFQDLHAGEYILVIRDQQGTEITNNFTIDDPSPLSLNVSNIEANIYNMAVGGTPPYSYSIDGLNYQESHIFLDIDRGTYQIYLQDSKGCVYSTMYELYYIIDDDMDGYDLADDCDDLNPNINPMAVEIPNNGIDEDCDGSDLTTAVNYLQENIFRVYPNPFGEVLDITMSINTPINVHIFNYIGIEVYTCDNANNILSISTYQWPAGMYTVQLTDHYNRVIKTRKLIKI